MNPAVVFERLGVILAILALVFTVLTVILIPILNPVFDPDWKGPHAWKGPRGAFSRALTYAGAVATRRGRRTLGDPDYDFRGRVGPVTLRLCQLDIFVGLALLIGLTVYMVLWAWLGLQKG